MKTMQKTGSDVYFIILFHYKIIVIFGSQLTSYCFLGIFSFVLRKTTLFIIILLMSMVRLWSNHLIFHH